MAVFIGPFRAAAPNYMRPSARQADWLTVGSRSSRESGSTAYLAFLVVAWQLARRKPPWDRDRTPTRTLICRSAFEQMDQDARQSRPDAQDPSTGPGIRALYAPRRPNP